MELISEVVQALLSRERALLSDLRTLLGRLDAREEDLAELKTALADLEGLFMIVVVGEYNSGKSSLLNTLLGDKVMLEGVTPTTDRITIVSYGPEANSAEANGLIMRRSFPAPILQDLALVDTPGTNAIIKEHQALTEGFLPRADLVLFVTSADRPFTESERTFLELIRSWGKKVVLVVNKLDILEIEAERQQVLDYVRTHVKETLGVVPEVFGVRAKQAFKARMGSDAEQLRASGVPELESYIQQVLSQEERLKLKLQTPLGVAQHMLDEYRRVLSERQDLLKEDRRTLDDVERQLAQFEKDMRREFESYLARVKTVLLEVERRGEVFFDDTVRLRNFFNLINTDTVRATFEARVIRGADMEIDRAVAEMVDWFIQRNLQLWEDVMQFVRARRKASEDRIIGEVGGRFQYDREALVRAMEQQAQRVLEHYDQQNEARRLADSLQQAVVQTGLIQVGGLGLGAAAVAFLSGAALDITGVVAGLSVVGLGLMVLPRRRQRAKRELHHKMQELRDGLATSIGGQFDDELVRAMDKLRAAMSPYTRFVTSELEHLGGVALELEKLQAELRTLRQEIGALTGDSASPEG